MKGPMHLIAAIGRGELMPLSDLTEQLKFYPHGQVVFYWLYFTGLWAIKLSFLLFFRGLGNSVRARKSYGGLFLLSPSPPFSLLSLLLIINVFWAQRTSS